MKSQLLNLQKLIKKQKKLKDLVQEIKKKQKIVTKLILLK